MAGTILLKNRTRIPFDVLAEMIFCASTYVKLPRRGKIRMWVSWGKDLGAKASYDEKKGDEVIIRIRIKKGCKHWTGVDLAFSTFTVMVHELFHASEYLSPKFNCAENAMINRTMKWVDRPHERRAMERGGVAAMFVLMRRDGARARKAIKKLAEEFRNIGKVFA